MSANAQSDAGREAVMKMIEMMSGFWVSRVIYIAAKLGLADELKDGPRDAAELAEKTNTHAPSLYRVMRALGAAGILVEDEEKRFSLTPLGETLRSDAPVSLRALATSELGEVHYPSWGALLHTVQTGEIAFDHVFGMNVWEYFAKHPENAKLFNQSMTDLTRLAEEAITSAYDFSSFNKIADLGGGHGSLLASILKKNPSVRGLLFDSPQVIEGAKKRMKDEGLTERCEVRAGNFFESVPAGADAYIMKHIIHDWADKESLVILKHIRGVIPNGGKLLLFEQVVPGGNEPHLSKFADLIMMIMTGGRERNAEEWRRLLEAGGFNLTRIIQTESPVSIIESVPA
jgi:ubiquinone/menaquinone biosynthesis C-methylase UbiE